MVFIYTIEGMHCSKCIEKIKAVLDEHVNIIQLTLQPPELHVEAQKAPSLKTLNQHIASAGKYRLKTQQKNSIVHTYYPLFIIVGYITAIAALNNVHRSSMNELGFMNQFMAGFFLVFSGFKLLDIKGFATGYATYDLLAKHWHGYGFIYPFLELSLGILYLKQWQPTTTAILTVLLMGFSSLGVINSLLKHQTIQCVCLGTILRVPLSNITLVEDLTMVLMASLSLAM